MHQIVLQKKIEIQCNKAEPLREDPVKSPWLSQEVVGI